MQDTKKLIIDTTIKLIKSEGSDPSKITMRQISKEAGIAVSQINYHFASKDNLIETCVQTVIDGVIKYYKEKSKERTELSVYDNVRTAINITYDYLFEHENLSRISILGDYKSPSPNDNTHKTIAAYLPRIRTICEERNLDNPEFRSELIAMTMQSTFLRTDALKDEIGIDLRKKEQRTKFIDSVLEQYLN